MPLLAAIDLGTNTARLLIGEHAADGTVIHHVLDRQIVRLGGGFTREEGLSCEARERALNALCRFAACIKEHKVERIRAVATSAVRDARNGQAFVEQVLEQTGISLEIIDGEEEGLLTLSGVHSGLDKRTGDFFVFDIGGGSTEYTLAEGKKPIFTRSLPLGVVRLTEGKGNSEAMADKIRRELDVLYQQLKDRELLQRVSAATLIGTAGTVTSLAAIKLGMTDYDYRKVNNFILSKGDVRGMFDLLAPLTPAERLKVPGLEKGREDLIIAGLILTLATIDLFEFSHLKVSDYSLLEGLLISLVP